MSESSQGKSNAAANAAFDGVVKLLSTVGRILLFGMRQVPVKKVDFYVYLLPALFFIYALAASQKDLVLAELLLPRNLAGTWALDALYCLGPWTHFFCIVAYLAAVVLFALGVKPFCEWKRYQRALDCLALKNGLGGAPKLVSLRADSAHRLRLRVVSEGVGIEKYESKKSDLESAMGAVIERIRTADNPKVIEIWLAKRKIPEVCQYQELIPSVTKPYSFLVGESIGGRVSQCIRELPHMLIAGTTGGGKSVFFKQALLGLLQTSPTLQMYLLDLKGGVEMKEFGSLPNVSVAKTEKDAVLMLRKIRAEMTRRFQFMEERGYKKIEPERDKLDLIVVGVDEASVLYTRSGRRSVENDLIDEARELTDQLAKLARAAGIHLILATQKVSKETIDTKIQENIGGRMCFRMNTLQGSLTVLGNKLAFELPDKPGRAIWAAGNNFTEVQAPLVSDEEIERECEVIKFEYEQGKRRNHQALLVMEGAGQASVPEIEKFAA